MGDWEVIKLLMFVTSFVQLRQIHNFLLVDEMSHGANNICVEGTTMLRVEMNLTL